ncbi:hypothetical protein CL684_02975 [Candidatus Campbellbacteria bacterium]|nr:hypothetical protein [Candidatus Campbellbacteria bacterium]|tara:strand:+ start:2767 stop:3567 length:801 start_codon:yes stop_codon:yes gene_type:complete
MNDTPYIRQEPVAKKYELSYDPDSYSFRLAFKESDLKYLRTFNRLQELIQEEEKVLTFQNTWNFSSNDNFGYDASMKLLIEDETVVLNAKVNRESSFAITKTFSFLFDLLSSYPIESKRPEPGEKGQEMLIRTTCSNKYKYYGAAMQADLSLRFSQWIAQQSDDTRSKINAEVNKSMNNLFKVLYQREENPSYANGLLPYGFLLQPPAGIYTCQFGIDGDDQDRLKNNLDTYALQTFCHNLDTYTDQLILLAGFSKICEAFRDSEE